MKFYQCEGCGKMIVVFRGSACPTKCCGEPMKEVIPGTVDAAWEKHIPSVTVEGNLVKVQVGSTIHPMLAEHHIEWIILETETGFQKRDLPADFFVCSKCGFSALILPAEAPL